MRALWLTRSARRHAGPAGGGTVRAHEARRRGARNARFHTQVDGQARRRGGGCDRSLRRRGGRPGARWTAPARPAPDRHRPPRRPAYRPEHTLASYLLAIEMGADYIEPDLVSTKDGELVARHEQDITGTTDVAAAPRVRRPAGEQDDRRQRRPPGSPRTSRSPSSRRCARSSACPTCGPQTRRSTASVRSRPSRRSSTSPSAHDVGIYPETKHPTFFESIGFSLDEPLLDTLRRNGLDRPGAKVFVQSFEVSNLRAPEPPDQAAAHPADRLARCPADFVAAGDPRTYDDLVTPAGLREIARTPTASARTAAASSATTSPAPTSARRRRSFATPTASGSWCIPLRSGRRTTSSQPTSASATRRARSSCGRAATSRRELELLLPARRRRPIRRQRRHGGSRARQTVLARRERR